MRFKRGQVLSISSLARDAETHRNTIAGYIEIHEDTLLAFRLEPYLANIRVKERKHPKLYFIDSGLGRALKRNLHNIAPEERGSIFEGWFINYTRAMNEYFHLYDEMNYWSPTGSRVEVDLILSRRHEKIAIEVKSSARLHDDDFSGLDSVAAIKGMKRRILVYQGHERRQRDGIEIVPIHQFFKEEMIKKI